ncbi:MAG: LPS export ABC transporter periplasmic protein LptC [Deltaproteobacteria bacterium RBG_13_52_11]|nr:MAG: LPS export ABC transporter periplasmic protein LptC [Deltaproteobacteria bacterium RBG_13_52_11]
MKRSKQIILICMGVVFFVVAAYLIFGGHGEEEETIPEVKKDAAATADLTLEDIHYVETKGKKKEWELKAKTGQHFRQDDYTILQDLTVTFYAEGGRTITLKGGKGSMKGRKEIEVWEDVVITSSDGYRVETNSLRYDNEKQQITTEDPVMLEGKGVQVRGVGAVVDLKTKKISILRKVQTVIKG